MNKRNMYIAALAVLLLGVVTVTSGVWLQGGFSHGEPSFDQGCYCHNNGIAIFVNATGDGDGGDLLRPVSRPEARSTSYISTNNGRDGRRTRAPAVAVQPDRQRQVHLLPNTGHRRLRPGPLPDIGKHHGALQDNRTDDGGLLHAHPLRAGFADARHRDTGDRRIHDNIHNLHNQHDFLDDFFNAHHELNNLHHQHVNISNDQFLDN
jgi:hypothetical protein